MYIFLIKLVVIDIDIVQIGLQYSYLLLNEPNSLLIIVFEYNSAIIELYTQLYKQSTYKESLFCSLYKYQQFRLNSRYYNHCLLIRLLADQPTKQLYSVYLTTLAIQRIVGERAIAYSIQLVTTAELKCLSIILIEVVKYLVYSVLIFRTRVYSEVSKA